MHRSFTREHNSLAVSLIGRTLKMFERFLALIAMLALLAGCAGPNKEPYLERDLRAISEAESSARTHSQERARVFFFREAALTKLTDDAIPFYYAINGKVVTAMPFGTHVVLSLEPGLHKFTSLQVTSGLFWPVNLTPQIIRREVSVDLAPGQTYYVGSRTSLLRQFAVVDEAEGKAIVAETQLAKMFHQTVTVDTFVSRVKAAARERRESLLSLGGGQGPARSSAFNLSDTLPTAQQVSDFLEVVAMVALVAVVIVGLAAGAAASGSPPSIGVQNLNSPPAVISSVAANSLTSSAPLRTSTGTLYEILNSREATEIRNEWTGVNYRIENGRVSGSDGSRYTVSGTMVYSDTGQSYQVVGDNIFSSDGRSCVRTGVIISCR